LIYLALLSRIWRSNSFANCYILKPETGIIQQMAQLETHLNEPLRKLINTIVAAGTTRQHCGQQQQQLM
jgi:hypothetical protein